MSIPLNAIDPEAAELRARRQFEHHLDLLAPVMDAIVTSTVPSLRAAKVEKRITGGGHVDNMTLFLQAFDQSTHGRGVGAGEQHETPATCGGRSSTTPVLSPRGST